VDEFDVEKTLYGDPLGRFRAAKRDVKHVEERLAATQGPFQKPPLAKYMAMKNDPLRKKSLYERFKEVKNANDETAQAMRADRLERWMQDAAAVATTVRGVLRINDEETISRSRPAAIRRQSTAADAVFMLDNVDALLAPIDMLNFAGNGAAENREAKQQEQARQEQKAELQAKYGIQRVELPQEKPKKKAPQTPQQLQQKKKEEVIVFDQPLSVAVGEFDRWMRKYLRRLNVRFKGMTTGRASVVE